MVSVVDDESVDGDSNVFYGEAEIRLLLKTRAPVRAERVLTADLAGRFLEAMNDIGRLEHDVVGVVTEDLIDIVGVPRGLPLAGESQSEVRIHGAEVTYPAPDGNQPPVVVLGRPRCLAGW